MNFGEWGLNNIERKGEIARRCLYFEPCARVT